MLVAQSLSWKNKYWLFFMNIKLSFYIIYKWVHTLILRTLFRNIQFMKLGSTSCPVSGLQLQMFVLSFVACWGNWSPNYRFGFSSFSNFVTSSCNHFKFVSIHFSINQFTPNFCINVSIIYEFAPWSSNMEKIYLKMKFLLFHSEMHRSHLGIQVHS